MLDLLNALAYNIKCKVVKQLTTISKKGMKSKWKINAHEVAPQPAG
uniref:Uncharacterized protein n=1 Tax=Siphoviridae sp. ctpoI7 TaxID=2825678 RepID=A0A8S5PB26_9CAUD|nr:MAG TPA: hypothetical protein [Siphoviridae sp. ctpoI7]